MGESGFGAIASHRDRAGGSIERPPHTRLPVGFPDLSMTVGAGCGLGISGVLRTRPGGGGLCGSGGERSYTHGSGKERQEAPPHDGVPAGVRRGFRFAHRMNPFQDVPDHIMRQPADRIRLRLADMARDVQLWGRIHPAAGFNRPLLLS